MLETQGYQTWLYIFRRTRPVYTGLGPGVLLGIGTAFIGVEES
jgi:hypothetical protein